MMPREENQTKTLTNLPDKLNILIAETRDFSNEAVSALHDIGTVHLRDINADEIADALNTYDVFWFRLGFKLTRELITGAQRCRFIICPVTGLDHIDLDACAEKNITVISLRGETTFLKQVRATAEHTLGLTLALLRQVPAAVHSVNNGVWNRNLFKGQEIYGKTVGILGVGRLGSITAGYFKAMGAHVLGYDIKPFDATICEPVQDIATLFRSSAIISVHVNLNPQTQHLVNRALLELMPKGSFLVNTSRGSIVNSEHLIEALTNGPLAAAAIDVIENEFDHAQDLLVQYAQQHNNLLITPHIGGNTYESFAKTELFMVQKLKAQLPS